MTSGKKTAIVTGISSGIGSAIAQAYLARGLNVVGCARTPERLRAAQKLGGPGRFAFLAGDISKPVTARALFRHAIDCFGAVDILINNAELFIAKPIVDYSGEELESMVDADLRGFFYPSQQAARHMSARGRGHIVNVAASLAAQASARAPAALASLMIGGIDHATRSLALELAPHHVNVNAVVPRGYDTPAAGSLYRAASDGTRETIREIVDAVLDLTDTDSMTGKVIPVGGLLADAA